jgi:hypothetical protein
VKRTIGVLDVKIAGVDTGVIGGRIALDSLKPTGTLSILSAAGAVSATVRSRARKISLFMIIYLSIFPTTSNIGLSSSTLNQNQPKLWRSHFFSQDKSRRGFGCSNMKIC